MAEIGRQPLPAGSAQTTKVESSRTRVLGYTLASYDLTMSTPEGNSVTDRGKYVAPWKSQADGHWKVVATIWNSDPPPAAMP